MNEYSDGGMFMPKCRWILLILSPLTVTTSGVGALPVVKTKFQLPKMPECQYH